MSGLYGGWLHLLLKKSGYTLCVCQRWKVCNEIWIESINDGSAPKIIWSWQLFGRLCSLDDYGLDLYKLIDQRLINLSLCLLITLIGPWLHGIAHIRPIPSSWNWYCFTKIEHILHFLCEKGGTSRSMNCLGLGFVHGGIQLGPPPRQVGLILVSIFWANMPGPSLRFNKKKCA